MVFANLGLKKVGEKYSQEQIDASISKVNQMYISNGWYSDGFTDQIDYYIAFAMHFYALIYAKVMEKEKNKDFTKQEKKNKKKGFFSKSKSKETKPKKEETEEEINYELEDGEEE